jgi:predicted negative regulator of RcsB-dependent stress response
LAGLQSEAGEHDAALATLAAAAPGFEGLVADRRGDVLAAQGKADEARAAYQAAYQALGETIDYRRVVEAKLTALGAPPAAPATPATPATSGAAS